MPNPDIKFDIRKVAADFLFVEDADFYPPEIFEEFEEALYLFLTDDELEVLNYRYGTEEFCSFSVDKRRRILSDFSLRFMRSEFYSEMDTTMKEYEASMFSSPYHGEFSDEPAYSNEFVKNALVRIGLEYAPGSVGECNYDSYIGNFPVYVWRFREIPMPERILRGILSIAAREGFGRFFLVADPKLTAGIPTQIQGFIPFTIIPLIEEPFDGGGRGLDEQYLPM